MAQKKSPLTAAVGLDIGSNMIKVVEARQGKNGPTITGLGIASVPEGVIENSTIMDPVAVGEAIKSLLAESDIKSKPVISAVAGQSSVVVRVIEVPKMSREELAETMKFEVERQVPLPLNEVLMDFAPLDKPNDPPDAQSMEVLLAVAQQDLVNNHVEALFTAGLAPKAIDIEPLASSRSLIEMDRAGAKDQIVAIVDIGSNNTDVSIFEGGLLTFACPPLQIAGIAFTQAISEYLQIPLEEAEQMKKQYAAVDPSKMGATAAGAYEYGEPGQPADGYDLGEATYGGPAPQSEPEAVAEDTPEEYKSPFDFGEGEGTGEPEPADSGAPQDDIYTVGEEQVSPTTKPVFDLDSDTPVDVGPAEKPEPDDAATQDYDLGEDDDGAESLEVAPVPLHRVGAPEAETRERIAEAIAPVLADLAAELRRFFEYYETRYNAMPERVFITGGTAKMRELDKFLEGELGIVVQTADPFKNITMNTPKHSEQYLKEIAPLFSVSIGLAVRELLPD